MVLIALPVFYFLIGFAGALIPGKGAWTDHPAEVRIGLIHGLIHYDLVLPMDDTLRQDFAFAGPTVQEPQAEWLLVGWGAEGFYTATGTYSEMSLKTAWASATGDAAVLRVEVAGEISQDYQNITWLGLSQSQYDALLNGVLSDFDRDASGQPIRHSAPGFTLTDSFWEAKGSFSILNTCNQWIARQFSAAGIPFGRWTPTIQAVDLTLWWNARP